MARIRSSVTGYLEETIFILYHIPLRFNSILSTETGIVAFKLQYALIIYTNPNGLVERIAGDPSHTLSHFDYL
jgi:hypothetical protein